MAEKIPDDRELLEGIGLSFAEAALLCEALRALWLSPKVIERTWLEMRDIIETEHLDQKIGHDCICSAGADRRAAAFRSHGGTAGHDTFLGAPRRTHREAVARAGTRYQAAARPSKGHRAQKKNPVVCD
jgi:hypothetical protein